MGRQRDRAIRPSRNRAAGCAGKPPVERGQVDARIRATAQVVDRVAQRYLAEAHLVGLSVAVARDGRIVHESAYGLARHA
jgi:CubicO group peptidase (beta-lactamase class C family)